MVEMLSMVDVCKSYGRRKRRVQILREVSLSVAAGEIVGIVGSRREGGTSLLEVAAGWIRPDEGQVRLGEVDLAELSRRRREKLRGQHVLWADNRELPWEMSWKVHEYVAWGTRVDSRVGQLEATGLAWCGLERVGALELAPIYVRRLNVWERLLVEFARIVATRRRLVVINDLFDDIGAERVQVARRLLRSLVDDLGCGVLLRASDLTSAWVADCTWRFNEGGLTLISNKPTSDCKIVALASSSEAVSTSSSVRVGEISMPDAINQLLATEVALDKLGVRAISSTEAEQAIWNRHVVIRNRRGRAERRQREGRRLLIGRSDGGRLLTLVIEETIEPTTWLLVTGWESTLAERMILEKS
jgi:predicted ABC-type transport system involved in lysophospholipase L1 biosynthesis ATPase subunit